MNSKSLFFILCCAVSAPMLHAGDSLLSSDTITGQTINSKPKSPAVRFLTTEDGKYVCSWIEPIENKEQEEAAIKEIRRQFIALKMKFPKQAAYNRTRKKELIDDMRETHAEKQLRRENIRKRQEKVREKYVETMSREPVQ